MLEVQRTAGAAEREHPNPLELTRPSQALARLTSMLESAWAMPLLLGAGFAFSALMLVFVELAQPKPQRGFPGIRFSNTVNSPGSRHIVALFRDHLEWLPRPFADDPLSPSGYVWGLRLAWIAMIVLQLAALSACRRARSTSIKPWIVGPVLASLVFLLYPPSSTDIYAYASFGWVAERGHNPYLQSPASLHGDPYHVFNDWTDISTPYGPIWTGISRAIVHFSGEQPFATALGYKIVATIPAFGLALVAYLLAKRFTKRADLAVTAFVFVWWSPILITEAAATVHLDALMMFLAASGLAVATTTGRWRSHRLGVALVVASALVKPVTLPLIALLVVVRVAMGEPARRLVRAFALDGVVALAVIAAAYAPFWSPSLPKAMVENWKLLYADEALHSNPLWMWGLAHVATALGFAGKIHADSISATRWLALGVGLVVGAIFLRALLRLRRAAMTGTSDRAETLHAMLRMMVLTWTGVLVVLSELPVNVHPWYAIWTLPLLALLWVSDGRRDRERAPVWLWVLQSWILLSFFIYHTLPKT